MFYLLVTALNNKRLIVTRDCRVWDTQTCGFCWVGDIRMVVVAGRRTSSRSMEMFPGSPGRFNRRRLWPSARREMCHIRMTWSEWPQAFGVQGRRLGIRSWLAVELLLPGRLLGVFSDEGSRSFLIHWWVRTPPCSCVLRPTPCWGTGCKGE